MPKSKESKTTSFPTSTDKKKRLKDKKKKDKNHFLFSIL